jgi:hypothetical protein
MEPGERFIQRLLKFVFMIYQQPEHANYPLAALEYNPRNTISKTKDGKNIVRAIAGKGRLTITEETDKAAKPNAATRNLVFLAIEPSPL